MYWIVFYIWKHYVQTLWYAQKQIAKTSISPRTQMAAARLALFTLRILITALHGVCFRALMYCIHTTWYIFHGAEFINAHMVPPYFPSQWCGCSHTIIYLHYYNFRLCKYPTLVSFPLRIVFVGLRDRLFSFVSFSSITKRIFTHHRHFFHRTIVNYQNDRNDKWRSARETSLVLIIICKLEAVVNHILFPSAG